MDVLTLIVWTSVALRDVEREEAGRDRHYLFGIVPYHIVSGRDRCWWRIGEFTLVHPLVFDGVVMSSVEPVAEKFDVTFPGALFRLNRLAKKAQTFRVLPSVEPDRYEGVFSPDFRTVVENELVRVDYDLKDAEDLLRCLASDEFVAGFLDCVRQQVKKFSVSVLEKAIRIPGDRSVMTEQAWEAYVYRCFAAQLICSAVVSIVEDGLSATEAVELICGSVSEYVYSPVIERLSLSDVFSAYKRALDIHMDTGSPVVRIPVNYTAWRADVVIETKSPTEEPEEVAVEEKAEGMNEEVDWSDDDSVATIESGTNGEPIDDEPIDDEPVDDELMDDEPVGDELIDDEPAEIPRVKGIEEREVAEKLFERFNEGAVASVNAENPFEEAFLNELPSEPEKLVESEDGGEDEEDEDSDELRDRKASWQEWTPERFAEVLAIVHLGVVSTASCYLGVNELKLCKDSTVNLRLAFLLDDAFGHKGGNIFAYMHLCRMAVLALGGGSAEQMLVKPAGTGGCISCWFVEQSHGAVDELMLNYVKRLLKRGRECVNRMEMQEAEVMFSLAIGLAVALETILEVDRKLNSRYYPLVLKAVKKSYATAGLKPNMDYADTDKVGERLSLVIYSGFGGPGELVGKLVEQVVSHFEVTSGVHPTEEDMNRFSEGLPGWSLLLMEGVELCIRQYLIKLVEDLKMSRGRGIMGVTPAVEFFNGVLRVAMAGRKEMEGKRDAVLHEVYSAVISVFEHMRTLYSSTGILHGSLLSYSG